MMTQNTPTEFIATISSEQSDTLKKFLESLNLEAENELSVFQTILRNKENIPPFRFDCGTEDELIASNRNVHQLLQEYSVKHIYEEFSGGHTGFYWKEHIQKSLLFFNTIIGS